MKCRPLLLLLMTVLMAGCSSRPAIPVSEQQALVMESSLLVAGISAEKPDIAFVNGATVSRSGLYNEQVVPVTIHYRFYWYDVKGLEIFPLEEMRSVTIPGKSSLTLSSTAGYPDAHKVRLYLSL